MLRDIQYFIKSTFSYFSIIGIAILIRMYFNHDMTYVNTLKLPLLIILILLNGFLFLRIMKLDITSDIQLFTFSITIGMASLVIWMFVLLLFHILNIYTILLLSVVLVLYNYIFVKENLLKQMDVSVKTFFIVGVIAIILLYFTPFEYIWGGVDASSYIFNAFNFLTKNSIIFYDQGVSSFPMLFTSNSNPNYETLKYAGYYITDINNGEITPQFFPGYSLLLSLGILFLGYKFFYINMLLLIVLFLTFYILVEELFKNSNFSWLIAIAMVVNVQIIWSSRITHTEIFTAIFILINLYSLVKLIFQKKELYVYPFLLSYTLLLITRIDLLFTTAAIVLLIFVYQNRFSRKIKILFVAITIISYVIMLEYSYPYISDIFYYIFHMKAIYVYSGFSAGLILIYLLSEWRFGIYLLKRTNNFIINNQLILKLLVSFIIAGLFFFLYFFFVEPQYVTYTSLQYLGKPLPTFNNENFYRLGWFFSPLGLALFVFGFIMMIIRGKNSKWFIIILFFLPTFYYLYHLSNNPLQIYGFRRYIPGLILFIYLTIAYILFVIRQYNKNLFNIIYMTLFLLIAYPSFSLAHSSWFKGATKSLHEFDVLNNADCIFILKEDGVAHWQGPTLEYYKKQKNIVPID